MANQDFQSQDPPVPDAGGQPPQPANQNVEPHADTIPLADAPQDQAPQDQGPDLSAAGPPQPDQQPQPPPQYPWPQLPQGRPRERFIRTNGRVHHSMWGMPDYILQGARRYPGIAPGPWMPQAEEVNSLIWNAVKTMSDIGSPQVAGLAMSMGDNRGLYTKDYMAGQHARAQLDLEKYTLARKQLIDKQTAELREYAAILSTYNNPDDPKTQAKLKQALIELAHEYNDTKLEKVINTEGVPGAVNRLNALHNVNDELMKIDSQADKQELDITKAELNKIKTEEALQKRKALEAWTNPDTPLPDYKTKPGPAQEQQPQQQALPPGDITNTPGHPEAPSIDSVAPQAQAQPQQQQAGIPGPQERVPAAMPGQQDQGVYPPLPSGQVVPGGDTGALPQDQPFDANEIPGVTTFPSDPDAPAAPPPSPGAPGAGAYKLWGKPNERVAPPAAPQPNQFADNPKVEQLAKDLLVGNIPLAMNNIPPEIREPARRKMLAYEQQLRDWMSDPKLSGRDVFERVKALDPFLAQQIAGQVTGTDQPSSAWSARQRPWLWVNPLAHRVDPSFNQGTFKQRWQTVHAFTIGKRGDSVVAIGTSFDHADDLLGLIPKLPGNFGGASTHIGGAIAKGITENLPQGMAQSGQETLAGWEAARNALGVEIAKVYQGGAPHQAEAEANLKLLDPTHNPAELKATIERIRHLIVSRIHELKDNYIQGTGFTNKPNDPVLQKLDSFEKRYNESLGQSGQSGDLPALPPGSEGKLMEYGGKRYRIRNGQPVPE